MIFVRQLESNVKGEFGLLLGPRTLIVGRNASGKTARVNALEIALSGAASDVAGRERMAKETELVSHLAPGHAGKLYSKATLSDGSEAEWTATKGRRAKHSVPPSVIPDAVFPLRALRAAVRGESDTARKFFLQFAVGKVSTDDVLALIPTTLQQYFRAAAATATAATAPVDRLLVALDHSKKKARECTAQAKAHREAAKQSAPSAAPPSSAELQEAKETARTTRAAADAAQRAAGQQEILGSLPERFGKLEEALDADRKALAAGQALLADLSAQLAACPPPPTIEPAFQAALMTVRWHAANAAPSCAVCGSAASPEAYVARRDAAEARLGALKAEAQAYNDLKARVERGPAVLETLRARIAANEAEKARLNEEALASAGAPDVAAAKAAAETAEQELRRLEVATAHWSTVRRAEENALAAETESGRWDQLHEACRKAVGQFLDAGLQRFVARVQKALPPSDRFDMELRDGDKEVFRFGLRRIDDPVFVESGAPNEEAPLDTALSGAEWARVTLAMATACISDDGKLHVFIPEDRDWDGVTLADALRAWSSFDAPVQIIVQTATTPVGTDALQGWTVIQTSDDVAKGGDDLFGPVPVEA